jgi:hypothetical protein
VDEHHFAAVIQAAFGCTVALKPSPKLIGATGNNGTRSFN